MLSKPLRRVAAALMFIAVASPALADNVSGVYVGTYTASKLPGETLHIVLTFYQAGTSLRGHYTTSSGVAGDGWGVLIKQHSEDGLAKHDTVLSWNLPRNLPLR